MVGNNRFNHLASTLGGAVSVLAITWVMFNPAKTDLEGFQWTQASKQSDWAISLPEAEGFKTERLLELHDLVTLKKTKKVQSLLIVRNGHLVFEQYYPVQSSPDGTPMPQYFPPGVDTYHQMRSVTKTVTSTLIGHLLYTGAIADKDTPLFDYFLNEDLQDDEKKQLISLGNALDFNSGLDWNEWGAYPSDAMGMWLSQDPYQYIFEKKIAHSPGEVFAYQGAMSVLLGGVVEKVTGKTLRQYAEQALFNPLGIIHYDWFAHEVTGDYLGSSGLYLRSRDLAKLGQLYLNNGVWQGKRIFSEQWAQQSLVPKGKFWPHKTIEYGHNWWFPLITVDGVRLTVAGMRGFGGQEMFIIPQHNLVIAMTSGAFIGQDEDFPFELMVDYILPAIGISKAKYISQV
ncbi:serine hydrolase [Photobacterium sp. DA100]|uniref:serine hydrolase domain-containing protein n=1 Tax=Photobacterium sp. DA100 TaxID=3027472 RepID=UPI00247A56B4|nr:serine hydrolase [Photobacterium sp. DA100]WEM41251.1 serine hydrolase [Photobacterium sp. DA100]